MSSHAQELRFSLSCPLRPASLDIAGHKRGSQVAAGEASRESKKQDRAQAHPGWVLAWEWGHRGMLLTGSSPRGGSLRAFLG